MADAYSSSQLVSAGINCSGYTYKQINETFEYVVRKNTFVCNENGIAEMCVSWIFFVKNCNLARAVFGDRPDIKYI